MTMKDFIGDHQVVSTADLVELALGTPLELWLGVENETEEEQAAREAAAYDILADDPGVADRIRWVAEAIETYMPDLLRITPVPSVPRHRASRTGAAA